VFRVLGAAHPWPSLVARSRSPRSTCFAADSVCLFLANLPRLFLANLRLTSRFPLPMGLPNCHLAGSSFNVDATTSEDLFVRICRPLMRNLSSEPAGGLCREPLTLVRSPLPALESASGFGDLFAFAATYS
jgi:hypothetical protein